jgi:hypothetical protein
VVFFPEFSAFLSTPILKSNGSSSSICYSSFNEIFFFFFYDERTGERMREKTRVVVFFRVVGTTKNVFFLRCL